MGGEPQDGGESGETDASALPRCAECGETVGVLEAAWLEGPDGKLRPSSVLNMDASARAGAHRVWHGGCIRLAPDDA